MQKETWWWGVKLEQVGSWVMMLMSLSLPPAPWFKQWLPWDTKMTAGNCLGAPSKGACGGRGGQTALQCSRMGCSHGSECVPPASSHHHPSNPLARPGHAWGPLQPEPTAAALRLLKNGPSQMPSKAAFQVMLFVQGREELAGLSLVAECDSHLQRLEVFVKGAGEASEAKRCFQEESTPSLGDERSQALLRPCCCSPSNCPPFPCQSPSTA